MVVAAIADILLPLIVGTAVFYLTGAFWMQGDITNPLTYAIGQAIWITIALFICDHFLLFERIDRWSWKSKKREAREL